MKSTLASLVINNISVAWRLILDYDWCVRVEYLLLPLTQVSINGASALMSILNFQIFLVSHKIFNDVEN